MSQGCSRAAIVVHKSLHGCGIVCWCSQLGKSRTPLTRSLLVPDLPCARSITSKTTENDDLVDKDTKQKGQSTLRERLKYLRTSVNSASTRVQDSLQGSGEKLLSNLYSLQTSSENKGRDSNDDINDSASGNSKAIANESDMHISSMSSDKNHDSSPSMDELGIKESHSIKSSQNDLQIESSPIEDQRDRTEFWINIHVPSFQDRIDRMKAPFQKMYPTRSSTSSSTAVSEDLQKGKDQAVESTPRFETRGNTGLQYYKDGQARSKSRDVDSLKPESFEVTAEGESDENLPKQRSGGFPKDNLTNPSLRFPASVNLSASVASLKKASDDTATFDLDASPILHMNVALLEPRGEGLGRNDKQVSAARETAEEARVRRERSEGKQEVASKTAKKQMKPVISRTCIDDRTRNLAIGFCNATSNSSRLLKLEKLAAHLTLYPESREVAAKEKLIPSLLKLRNSWDNALTEQIHEALALMGYAAPVKGRGLRILSVDGGGTRGVIAIETLREIERRTKKPIRDLFDYIMGVSSGAVLCFLLSFEGASLDECEELYKELSQEVFKRNTFLGTSKLFFNHAFYDTEGWIKILRDHSLGDIPMISTAKDASCPKVAAVATMMNIGYIKDFLFRNYNLPPGVQSHYRGSCKYDLWQAARASSAAPGYFEECKLDDYVFQDGGVLTNNPCALAIHECRLLWPDTPIQSVVSVGCGRYDPSSEGQGQPEYSSLKKKLTNIMVSATDTESVHTVMQDLLPSGAYFRFNPRITEDFFLDENRVEKIQQMQREARDYLEFNELKLQQASGVLAREKTHLQRLKDWVELQRELRR